MHTFLLGDGEIQKGYFNLSFFINEGPDALITFATKREQFVPDLTRCL